MTPALPIDWSRIGAVLLDMDGTLLDKHFDDYFWQTHLPRRYADCHGLTVNEAEIELSNRYRSQELTLNWTDLNYWSRSLGVDIPTLKEEVAHLIVLHPTTEAFLSFVKAVPRRLYLVTNAHTKTLEMKMQRARIADYFDGMLCSCEVGFPKEDPRYWEAARDRFGFDADRALLVDDDPNVLATARTFGIGTVVQKLKPNSQKPPAQATQPLAVLDFLPLMNGSHGR